MKQSLSLHETMQKLLKEFNHNIEERDEYNENGHPFCRDERNAFVEGMDTVLQALEPFLGYSMQYEFGEDELEFAYVKWNTTTEENRA